MNEVSKNKLRLIMSVDGLPSIFVATVLFARRLYLKGFS